MEYPKTHSIYQREGAYVHPVTGDIHFAKGKKHDLIMGLYSCPEFGMVKEWDVFEKVDGTNIRVYYEEGLVRFEGRTKNAQIPKELLAFLENTFTAEKIQAAIPGCANVVLYGEGFGPKIQDGFNYSYEYSFILFDVLIGQWWLKYEDRLDIATKLGIKHVPYLGRWDEQAILSYVSSKPKSTISINPDYEMEGVVCVAPYIMRNREGKVIKYKVLAKDL